MGRNNGTLPTLENIENSDGRSTKNNDLFTQLDINSFVSILGTTKKINSEDDNSTITSASASGSAKNKDFNGFVGSEKRNPNGENDLFTLERNSERKIINVFLSIFKSPSEKKNKKFEEKKGEKI